MTASTNRRLIGASRRHCAGERLDQREAWRWCWSANAKLARSAKRKSPAGAKRGGKSILKDTLAATRPRGCRSRGAAPVPQRLADQRYHNPCSRCSRNRPTASSISSSSPTADDNRKATTSARLVRSRSGSLQSTWPGRQERLTSQRAPTLRVGMCTYHRSNGVRSGRNVVQRWLCRHRSDWIRRTLPCLADPCSAVTVDLEDAAEPAS